MRFGFAVAALICFAIAAILELGLGSFRFASALIPIGLACAVAALMPRRT